jgi:hypothetical protein
VTPTFDRLLAASGVHFERGEVVSLDRKARKAVIKPFDQTGSEVGLKASVYHAHVPDDTAIVPSPLYP